jgi:hypothetical protein
MPRISSAVELDLSKLIDFFFLGILSTSFFTLQRSVYRASQYISLLYKVTGNRLR